MRHFFRTSLAPAHVMESADSFFTDLRLSIVSSTARERLYEGVVGAPEVLTRLKLTARPEGGHYTFVEATTDQMGESRLDRNVKRFFVTLKNTSSPRRRLEAAY